MLVHAPWTLGHSWNVSMVLCRYLKRKTYCQKYRLLYLVLVSDLVDSESADLCLYCHQLARSHFQHLDISKHRTTLRSTAVDKRAGCHDDETVLFRAEELSQNQRENRLVKRCCFCGQKIEPLSRGKPGSEELRVTERGHGMEVLRKGCAWGEAENELEVKLVRGWESGSEGEDGDSGKQVSVELLLHWHMYVRTHTHVFILKAGGLGMRHTHYTHTKTQ